MSTTTSTTKKTIVVLGALGAQGGSVVKSLIQDGTFHIRAVTRSVDSDKAKALKEQGVQVVAGDVKEPSSLKAAFQGAETAFVVVNFWDPEIMTKEGELTHALFDVAKEAGVKHLIYSSLANVQAVSDGKLDVPHFTMKAKAFDYAKTLGFQYLTAVEPAAYYSNWLSFFKPTKEDNGTLVWKFPGKGKISQYDASSGTGPGTVAVAKDPVKYQGKFVLLEADCLTAAESIALISKKINVPARVEFVEPSVFAQFFPGAHEIAEMVKWFDLYGYYGPETAERKTASGKQAAAGMLSMEEWLNTEAAGKLLAELSE